MYLKMEFNYTLESIVPPKTRAGFVSTYITFWRDEWLGLLASFIKKCILEEVKHIFYVVSTLFFKKGRLYNRLNLFKTFYNVCEM